METPDLFLEASCKLINLRSNFRVNLFLSLFILFSLFQYRMYLAGIQTIIIGIPIIAFFVIKGIITQYQEIKKLKYILIQLYRGEFTNSTSLETAEK